MLLLKDDILVREIQMFTFNFFLQLKILKNCEVMIEQSCLSIIFPRKRENNKPMALHLGITSFSFELKAIPNKIQKVSYQFILSQKIGRWNVHWLTCAFPFKNFSWCNTTVLFKHFISAFQKQNTHSDRQTCSRYCQ